MRVLLERRLESAAFDCAHAEITYHRRSCVRYATTAGELHDARTVLRVDRCATEYMHVTHSKILKLTNDCLAAGICFIKKN